MRETWEAEASRTRKVTAADHVQLHTSVVPDPSAHLVGMVTNGPSCTCEDEGRQTGETQPGVKVKEPSQLFAAGVNHAFLVLKKKRKQ